MLVFSSDVLILLLTPSYNIWIFLCCI